LKLLKDKFCQERKMDRHLALFEKALTLYEEGSRPKNTHSLSLSSHCAHSDTIEDSCKTICVNCGHVLIENFIPSNQVKALGMKKRKKDECSIYNDIPSHIPQYIKDATIKLYLKVMNGEKHRSTAPNRAVILACLYHASLCAKNDISYDDLLEMFRIPQQMANKGFATVVSANIVDIKETISKTNEEENIIRTILRNLNMISFLQPVSRTYFLVKERSTLLHTSLVKSVVSGCIYFWIVQKTLNKSLKEFSKDMEMSQHTILGKYIGVTETVMLRVMKELFSKLLANSIPIRLEKCKYRQVFRERPRCLYVQIASDKKAIVENPFNPTEIRVCKYNDHKVENVYPLDEVDDIMEWNLLLNNKFYSMENGEMQVRNLNIVIVKNSKDVFFNFEEYNKNSYKPGGALFQKIISQKFEIKIDL
jgi:transcription initiation factor TFIIIB Brf1 subunit/transcription initiation factor TFIIB